MLLASPQQQTVTEHQTQQRWQRLRIGCGASSRVASLWRGMWRNSLSCQGPQIPSLAQRGLPFLCIAQSGLLFPNVAQGGLRFLSTAWRGLLSPAQSLCQPGGPESSPIMFFWGGYTALAVVAGPSAEAKATEAVLPWPPVLSAPPCPPELPALLRHPELPTPPWAPDLVPPTIPPPLLIVCGARMHLPRGGGDVRPMFLFCCVFLPICSPWLSFYPLCLIVFIWFRCVLLITSFSSCYLSPVFSCV